MCKMNFESAVGNMKKHKRRTAFFNRNRSIRKNEKRLLLLWDDANSSLTNKISTDKKGLSGRAYLFLCHTNGRGWSQKGQREF